MIGWSLRGVHAIGVALIAGGMACGSEAAAPVGSGGTATTGTTTAAGTATTSGTTTTTTTGTGAGGGSVEDGGGRRDARAPRDSASSAGDTGANSKECQDYCSCYEERCAGFVAIPGGMTCPDFCATFSSDTALYTCRYGMCFYNSKGPAENNNNHCQHSVGIDQCIQ